MNEQANWRVSAYSASEGNCVEVGSADDAILVRDTKNRGGGSLHVSPGTWRRFAATIKTRALPR